MKVVVAEKPSVARDLASFLGARRRCEGYFEGEGWAVSWALGHLAELKTPDEYDPKLKRWALETLPFVPDKFELRPAGDQGARRQLAIVARLCREADELICATDAGREGELIFRYLLEIAGCPEREFQRLWLSSLTEEAIRSAFAELKPGADYEPLHDAARSRSESDWIVGLNATRAYTVRYGGGGVLWSVGRVQTPVLALIAQRDDEIRCFNPNTFWELRTVYRDARFKYQGERFSDQEEAKQALAKVQDQDFTVTDLKRKQESQAPPLLYDLTQLQRDMNLRFGMSAARTLKVAQDLYERKLLTYPRTDCRHLTNDMVQDVHRTLANLRHWNEKAVNLLDFDKLPTTKRIFDDKKVSDHHAIIPTGKPAQGLDQEHARVFDAVARRLVQAFLPDKKQEVTTVDGESGGLAFRARGVVITQPGWYALEPKKTPTKSKKQGEDQDDSQELPAFETGETGPHQPELHEGSTKPPRPYTENTLLAAMETAGKLVDDEELREAMKARGLGTPATRASILETLISRRYVYRDKKALRVTDLGRYLCAIVQDPLLKSPELTGEWEHKLKEVEAGRLERSAFMAEIRTYIEGLLQTRLAPAPVEGLGCCPRCGKPVIEGKEGFGCSGWQDGCHFVLWKQYRGVTLSAPMARELIGHGVLLRPMRLDEVGPRILCLTAAGLMIDLEPPSRDAQRGPQVRPRRASKPAAGGKARAAKSPAKPRAKAGPKPAKDSLPACPSCGKAMIAGERGFGCSGWRDGCRFVIWKQIGGKDITPAIVRTLVDKGKTRLLKGFDGDARGRLILENGEVKVEHEGSA